MGRGPIRNPKTKLCFSIYNCTYKENVRVSFSPGMENIYQTINRCNYKPDDLPQTCCLYNKFYS